MKDHFEVHHHETADGTVIIENIPDPGCELPNSVGRFIGRGTANGLPNPMGGTMSIPVVFNIEATDLDDAFDKAPLFFKQAAEKAGRDWIAGLNAARRRIVRPGQ
jgi:hypothetical protein